jgi:hypothetical protein
MKHPQGHPDAIALKDFLMGKYLHDGVFWGKATLPRSEPVGRRVCTTLMRTKEEWK